MREAPTWWACGLTGRPWLAHGIFGERGRVSSTNAEGHADTTANANADTTADTIANTNANTNANANANANANTNRFPQAPEAHTRAYPARACATYASQDVCPW